MPSTLLSKIGAKLPGLRNNQADYIGARVDGPFNAEHDRG